MIDAYFSYCVEKSLYRFTKFNSRFRRFINGFESVVPDQTLWKIDISSVGTTIDEKKLIPNFENPTPDSDSPYPINFDQTLWKIDISSVGTTIDEKNLIPNFENPTPDSDSPYPINFDQTLWKINISSVGTTIDEKNLIPNFENPDTRFGFPIPD